MERIRRRLAAAVLAIACSLAFSTHARAQFAVIDAQNAANQIMSYIQDGENALMSIEGIANVFESLENVHAALETMQSIYNTVSPIIREVKAVTDIAVNYARIVDDWAAYCKYVEALDKDSSYQEIRYSYFWGTRLIKNAAEDFEYAHKLIASRELNMNDYERYSQLQQLSQHLLNIHRSFRGDLTRKENAQKTRRAMKGARSGLRQVMK